VGNDFKQLRAGVQSGDPTARESMAQLVLADLRTFVIGQMGREVRRRAEPEDVVQESLLTFFQRLATFPPDLDLDGARGYLFQIAKWRVSDVLRARKLEVGESAAPPMDPERPEPSVGPVTREDERQHLHRAISRMRETYSSVLRCCVIEGRGIADAAVTLGLTEETVRKRLSRAREELRRILGEQ